MEEPENNKDDRKKVAVIAIEQMIKQKNEVTAPPEWVEAPDIPRPEEQVETGSSQRQIEARMRSVAEKGAAGFNTTGMGVGMRELGFAISKSRGDMEKKGVDGGKINVKAIAKQAETVVARKKYTLADLQNKDVPGVPKHAKEEYLNDEDFVVAFGMERDQFERLPPWRQKNLKQQANLF